jgi:hypothetical protein
MDITEVDNIIPDLAHCNSHPENKITLYCLCGQRLCISCLDIHFHENLVLYDSEMLKTLLEEDLPLMNHMVKELEDNLINSLLDKDKLGMFKELRIKIEYLKDEVDRPEKMVEYLKENYRAKLEGLLIQSLYNSNAGKKKLDKFIQDQQKKEKRKEQKLKIKKIDKNRLLENEVLFAPSPKKQFLSSNNKLSSNKKSIYTSQYGSSRGNKPKKQDNLMVSNFNIQYDQINDHDSYRSEDSLEEVYNIATGTHLQQQEKVNFTDDVPFKVVKKESETGRKLSICDNCNCYFILTKEHTNNLCSKCRKTEEIFKEKVKLVCVNCRDTFSVEKSEECMLRTKCDICSYNSKL